MPSISVNITTGADNGNATLAAGASFHNYYSGTYINIGHFGTHTYIGALRFQAVNIPQASTISSATLTLIKEASGGTPSAKIYGDNVDNAPSWGAGNRVNNIAKTAHSTIFDTTNANSANNVTAIVQDIVNRAGWVSGNAISFGAFPQVLTGNNFWVGFAFKKGAPDIPSLSVTYTSGGTTYNDTISDSVTGADTEAAVLTANAIISDSTASSDSLVVTATFTPSVSDSTTSSDSLTATATINATASDSTAAADSIVAAGTFTTSLSDSATAADTITGGSATYDDTISDAITAADTMVGALISASKSKGGGGYKKPKKVILKPESVDRRKLEEAKVLRREIEEAYNSLHGIHAKPEREAAKIVKPFVAKSATPQKWLPPAAEVDFDALTHDLSAAKALLQLYQDQLNDDEEALFMLLAA